MKRRKFVVGSIVFVFAAVGALASAKNHKATDTFYSVGLQGTSEEDCIPFSIFKDCIAFGPGCVELTPNGLKQLYLESHPIGETGRFHCEVELFELP